MRSGDTPHRIAISDPTPVTQSSFGEDVVSNPTDVGTFWCKVEALQGRELESARQRWAEARYKITMRKQAVTFTRKMTGLWNGRHLNILDVQDVGGNSRPEVMMYAMDFDG